MKKHSKNKTKIYWRALDWRWQKKAGSFRGVWKSRASHQKTEFSCVCVCERERQRQRERQRETERDRERHTHTHIHFALRVTYSHASDKAGWLKQRKTK